jgi:hypothetical protein
MISSEVQRTLVKSPPELWSELSDPAALARHLGELGEIRITRVEPEQTVEWEAENTTGTVVIKPSGWGTRVTLTVNREIPEPEPTAEIEPEPRADAEPEPFIAPILAVEPDLPAWIVSGPTVAAESEPAADAEQAPPWEPVGAPERAPEPEPMPRRGFFARLFGRGRREQPVEPDPPELISVAEADIEPTDAIATEIPAIEPEGGEAEPEASEAEPEPSQEQARDISAELKAAEEIAAEEVTAVLTSVLDRLGAAHHRPFSRA